MRPRLLFYCQHSLGLGHLARALRLAEPLSGEFDVVLLNGGRFPEATRVPVGVAVMNLPPLGHDASYKLVSHDPALTVDQAKSQRRRMILNALETWQPQVVLIEMYPFGRKKFEFELVPLLDAAATCGGGTFDRPVIVCSLRDILVNQRADQVAYDDRCSERANRWFDAILVHADPAFARLEASFRPSAPLRVPVHYTGFVAPESESNDANVPTARLRRVLVSSGGGMVGEPLVRAAVAAHEAVHAHSGLSTTIVAGPFLPDAAWVWLQQQAARSPWLDAVRRVDDLCLEMRRSTVSLSQGGYNTTMDLLRARTPAVVVPFAEGSEDEQGRRTERLDALGVVRMLRTEEVTTPRLVEALVTAASAPPAAMKLDLGGAEHTATIVGRLARTRALAGAPR